jgi:hypothetical protein
MALRSDRTLWLGVALLAGCGGGLGEDVCQDFSALQGGAEISTVTESLAPVEARYDRLGRLRALEGDFPALGATKAEAAGAFLLAERGTLGLPEALELGVPELREGRAGSYLRFLPTYEGLRVIDADTVVHLHGEAPALRVHVVTLRLPEALSPAPLVAPIGPDEAISAALTVAGVSALAGAPEAELVVVSEPAPGYFAYRVLLPAKAPRGQFEVLVDAESGAVTAKRDLLRYADGTGLVFDPSPVGSTGNTALRDNNDATNATLDGARFSVTLRDLDGSGFLRGSFADVQDAANPRTNALDLVFNFDRNASGFEEVMTYFHIDRVQRRIQALGFTDIINRPQKVFTSALADDQSFYSPADRSLNFGTGGVDDAEDADIIVHEYGHAIQDDQGMGGGGDEGAMGEGFGDYLAASMMDVLSPEVSDTACVGDWDSTSYSSTNPPCLRRVDGRKHFPEFADGEVHDDGEMWAAALFALRESVGPDVADSLILESQFLLGGAASYQEGAQALLTADEDLFFGQNAEAISRVMIDQGLSRTLTPALAQGAVVDTQNVLVDPCEGQCGNFLDDTQIITSPGAFALRLHFAEFDTEVDGGCFGGTCDNVYLYDSQGRLYSILGGNLGRFDSVTIPGDTVQVRVVTDVSVNSRGYRIDRFDVIAACP